MGTSSRRILFLATCLALAGCAQAGSGLRDPAGSGREEARPVLAGGRVEAAAPYTGELPDYAERSAEVAGLYRWAATNRQILQYIQCTCGCERSRGHRSNWNCYVSEERGEGGFRWDRMAAVG